MLNQPRQALTETSSTGHSSLVPGGNHSRAAYGTDSIRPPSSCLSSLHRPGHHRCKYLQYLSKHLVSGVPVPSQRHRGGFHPQFSLCLCKMRKSAPPLPPSSSRSSQWTLWIASCAPARMAAFRDSAHCLPRYPGTYQHVPRCRAPPYMYIALAGPVSP